MSQDKKDGKAVGKQKQDAQKEAFLASYSAKFSIAATCAIVGVGRATVFRWRENDPIFAERFNAIDSQITDTLQARAITRALTDADQSSATLLIFLLKARLPEVYREKIVHEVNLRFANTLIADVTLILRKHLPVELSNTIAKELESLSNRLVGQSE
jgi:hypothetical protein